MSILHIFPTGGMQMQNEDGSVVDIPMELAEKDGKTTFKAEIPTDEPFTITGEFSQKVEPEVNTASLFNVIRHRDGTVEYRDESSIAQFGEKVFIVGSDRAD